MKINMEEYLEKKEVIAYDTTARKKGKTLAPDEQQLVNPLRDERVIVRFIRKPNSFISDKQHVMFGGMHEKAKRRFVVPMTRTGALMNVLTNSEKDFFESFLGLEKDALSVYRKKDNYWTNNYVELGKEDSVLDLSVPRDYIKYKILLANKEFIAPSKEAYDDEPKASCQYMLIREQDKNKSIVTEVTLKSNAYRLLDKLSERREDLAGFIYLFDGRLVSPNVSDEELLALAGTVLERDPAAFIRVASDPYFEMKVFVNNCVSLGLLRRVAGNYSLAETNRPLAHEGQEATLDAACAFLNMPENHEVLLVLQTKYHSIKKR
jgi:hypothetical protein